MIERRKARRAALEILYQEEIKGQVDEGLIDQVEQGRDFCARLIEGVEAHRSAIDEAISSAAAHWSIGRMPMLDRNILRIAVFEMLYEPEIPVSVSINEAIELAKLFGTPDSAKFVNGVLGKIAKSGSEVRKAAEGE